MTLIDISNTPAFQAQAAQPGLILVDFWAPWCGPCKALTPVLEELSRSYPDVRFLKVNADDPVGQVLAPGYGVASLPTLLLLRNGGVVNKMAGNVGRSQLKTFIESGL